jgi:hypothetical protein
MSPGSTPRSSVGACLTRSRTSHRDRPRQQCCLEGEDPAGPFLADRRGGRIWITGHDGDERIVLCFDAPAAPPLIAGDSIYTLEPTGDGAQPFSQMLAQFDINKNGKIELSEVSGAATQEKITGEPSVANDHSAERPAGGKKCAEGWAARRSEPLPLSTVLRLPTRRRTAQWEQVPGFRVTRNSSHPLFNTSLLPSVMERRAARWRTELAGRLVELPTNALKIPAPSQQKSGPSAALPAHGRRHCPQPGRVPAILVRPRRRWNASPLAYYD